MKKSRQCCSNISNGSSQWKRQAASCSRARFNRAGVQDEGLTLLRADNWEDAERVAATDPFVICGAVTFYIERFLLGAGRISVSIDLSDSTIRFL